MELKDNLTNESISKRFINQFDLVNYSILLAEQLIKSGRAPRVKTHTENPALVVLEEIVTGKDTLEDTEVKKEERMPIMTSFRKEQFTSEETVEISTDQEIVS